MKNEFVGIVLGGDMNSYAVARAFYEEYKIKTIILGQRPIFPTKDSKLTECYYNPKLLEDDALVEMLKMVEDKYPNKKKILFGNTDYYARHIIKNRSLIESISDNFIIPITTVDQFDELFAKDSFYNLCEKYGLDYPKYTVFDFKKDDIKKYSVPYEYPVFIKPADTVLYANYTFKGKQKGYKIENRNQFETALTNVKESGYDGKFIVQEYIEGSDDTMFVYTAYVNKNHKVKAITGGKILMHDRTPGLIGNYNAITNAYDENLISKLKSFLEKIEFTGICHFDIQYDKKRKKYYVFEINIRQGRSNLYTLASGVNLAKLIVDDYIYDKDEEFFVGQKKFTVSVPPKCVLKHFLKRSGQKYKIKNFLRFGLAKYDFKFVRLYYQFRWDVGIVKEYIKYNRPLAKLNI